jgi:NADH dehydrogenase FAD-containing subunit
MGKTLVLVGAGHAHMTCLLNLTDYQSKGHRVVVVSPSRYQYYSGMGPGMLSGIYRPQETRFNVKKMAETRGAAFIRDRVMRVDTGNRVLHMDSGLKMTYDVASFNIGSEVDISGISGGSNGVFPVKPILNLLQARKEILTRSPLKFSRIVVVGNGAAGVELAGNVWRLLIENGRSGEITLVGSGELLKGTPEKVRKAARKSLNNRGVAIHEHLRVKSVRDGQGQTSEGFLFQYDFALMATGIRPPGVFRDSGIKTDQEGGMLVNLNLQSISDPHLFGGGDCVGLEGRKVAKVGVYAVRQNPILHNNLLAALEGGRMLRFHPDGDYMLILNMGDGRGIAWKNGFTLYGRCAFALKNFIDKRFMRRYQVSGELLESSVI